MCSASLRAVEHRLSMINKSGRDVPVIAADCAGVGSGEEGCSMTREQMLDLLMLLAGLESWAFSQQRPSLITCRTRFPNVLMSFRSLVLGSVE